MSKSQPARRQESPLYEVPRPGEKMWALVYNGPGQKAWQERPRPKIQADTDAVVRILQTTICGTDLHILKGDVPEVQPGTILGHEGVGVIEAVGEGVTAFKAGDRVLISCITSCGRCARCKRAMYSHCEKGGWMLGHTIDGTQAEYVRIPFADTSLYAVPVGLSDEAVTMLSDIFPTGYECGVLNGKIRPGDSVAIIGAGPIGLAALLTAQFYSPGQVILADPDEFRLNTAQDFGATLVIDSGKEDPVEKILSLTDGIGVDVAIEAVGTPETFLFCEKIVKPGGHIANIGVHGKSVELRMQELWSKNITIKTRLVDTESTPLLLKMVERRKLDPGRMITHRFKLSDAPQAYDVFAHAKREHALKVIMGRD